jgi:hypothetical protein
MPFTNVDDAMAGAGGNAVAGDLPAALPHCSPGASALITTPPSVSLS